MEPMLTIATAVASKVVTTALEPLIRELITAQEKQNAELEQLRQEVRQLIDGPWRRSMLHLRAAEAAGDADPARRAAELEKAAEALLRAYSFHPDASATRALIAADLALVEGLIGRRSDATRWATTAYDDITTFLQQEAPRVQEALNTRPPLADRLRSVLTSNIWNDVLGIMHNVPGSAAHAEGDGLRAWFAGNVLRKREFLERGLSSAPGWRPHPRWEFQWVHGDTYAEWTSSHDNWVVFTDKGAWPHIRALVELHAAASLARTLRQVCAQFGQRGLPTYHLVVRLRRRYGAEVSCHVS